MKRQGGAAVVALAWVCGWTLAAAELAGPGVEVAGRLRITASDGPRVTEATITGDDGGVLYLEMDVAGEDLAKVMFNQRVAVRGVRSERDGRAWLRVTAFADEKHAEAHELWRRSRCNACVLQKAAVHAATPADLRGAPSVAGRLYPYRSRVVAWCRAGDVLWLATDSTVHGVDTAARAEGRVLVNPQGDADRPILDVAAHARRLWVVARGAAAVVDTETGRSTALRVPAFDYARVCAGTNAAWLIADTFSARADGQGRVETHPAIPTGARMSAELRKGMWFPAWRLNTAYYVGDPVCIGERVYAVSFGDVYELDGGAWKKVVAGGFQQSVAEGRLWVLTAEGVVELEPDTGALRRHVPAGIADGRLTGFAVTPAALWVTAEATGAAAGGRQPSGGVARLDRASGEWRSWKRFGEVDATHAVVGVSAGGEVWVATHGGAYRTLTAHPGMTYVKKDQFETAALGLHRWDGAAGAWTSLPVPYGVLGRRYICGQDGEGSDGDIVPGSVDVLCAVADRVVAATRLVAKGSFSGYWPCVNVLAERRADGDWAAGFDHRPESLGLQGEEPLVLNISNKGEMILPAVGHDEVLGLFERGGRVWAVTEGGAGWLDGENGWVRVASLAFNFDWRATAVLDEGAEVFIGSDRGFVCRLESATGKMTLLGGLSHRSVTALRREEGGVLAVGGPAPLGAVPRQLRAVATVDAEAALWTGTGWAPAVAPALPAPTVDGWGFRPPGEPNRQGQAFLREMNVGNMLWGPDEGGRVAPRYYVREVFMPRYLAHSADGKRLWVSTFGGIVKIALDRTGAAR